MTTQEIITEKAPHYFLVHFYERYTSIDGPEACGKPYPIVCDGICVNVYGFKSDAEAAAYDPLKLRGLLIGLRERSFNWAADSEEQLLKEIAEDQDVKNGTFFLNESATYGAYENLPSCDRMYIDSEKDLHCGKPENEYGDGSCGGCVLQHYDQDDPFADGTRCPMHVYWEHRFLEAQKNKVT